MEICYRPGSILFPLNILAVAGFFLMCLFKFIEILRYRLLPQSEQNLKRRKKRAAKKNKTEFEPNKDVPVADNSHSAVEPLHQSHSQLNDSAVEPLHQSHSQQLKASVEALRQFTYDSLYYATYQFGTRMQMNGDWLGDVFRGNMLYTHEVFAIRRLKKVCFMTNEEFYEELSLLAQLNHPNLAKLIGYFNHLGSRALVYEYLHGGSLENYLHGNKMCLDWRTRMKIVLGVARAIEYLQNAVNPPILHCSIEPANVWLDEDFTPKLSAAGVIRMFPTPSRTGYPIEAHGSFAGAHDLCLTKTLTLATDIYGFGILLLEVITARKGRLYRVDGESQSLINWVQPYFKDGNFMEMVDPRIKGKIDENELNKACAIAGACLENQPCSRPQIADVVRRLDHLVG